MISPLFNPPPSSLKLNNDEVHVWKAFLDQPAAIIQTLAQTLSIEEKKRSEQFHFDRDRERFIVGRGILRAILGCYLSVEPNRLQFSYEDNGKPRLVEYICSGTIHFNLSHSDDLALYGFTRDREIGVDIERIRDIPEMEQIAERFFSERENAVFRALPQGKKKKAFFKCWTRKEAFIKAIGNGLSMPLDEFEVTLMPGESAKLLSIKGNPRSASRWSIQDLELVLGYAAAFAIERQNWHLSSWQWQG
jgi:4'-phosphopantetheinyl transferase